MTYSTPFCALHPHEPPAVLLSTVMYLCVGPFHISDTSNTICRLAILIFEDVARVPANTALREFNCSFIGGLLPHSHAIACFGKNPDSRMIEPSSKKLICLVDVRTST